ncbi:hypothetical protein HG530_012662 [Fusarium avenaceum]|nr:hypothetical protein HG530_012662 [Fusarium avenaceum]
MLRSILSLAAFKATERTPCKSIPGDAAWPSTADWSRFNATINGRLSATIPLGHVCHDPTYNKTQCAELMDGIVKNGAEIFEQQPGEVMNPYVENLTCSPFTSASLPCTLGNRPDYAVSVTGAADIQAGLVFARENKVRLVIKSTGIDYMGKSSGQGSLVMWMHNLKSIHVMDDYTSKTYSGPAVKLGSGVIAGEAYEAVSAAGYRIVAPECGLTGVVGGYTQGGGHSQLTTAYGLAADQVLEWELVTPTGDYVIATPEDHFDLYWALCGGGGGTYGIVLSATVRAYPDGPVAGGTLLVENTNSTAFWEAIGIWFRQAPSFVDETRNNIQFLVTNTRFIVFAFVMPDQQTSAITTLISPFLLELKARGLGYDLETRHATTYVESLVASYGELPYGNLCPNYPIISSRLIPRSTVLDAEANGKLMHVYRNITSDGSWFIGCSIINTASDSTIRQPHPPNAVHPAWREAVAYCNPNREWDWNDHDGSLQAKHRLVNEYFPAMEAATPGSGVYLNEMDPLYQGEWKDTMYGPNYERLLEIKHRHDPDKLMYAPFAVGADEFTLDDEGRLCAAEPSKRKWGSLQWPWMTNRAEL